MRAVSCNNKITGTALKTAPAILYMSVFSSYCPGADCPAGQSQYLLQHGSRNHRSFQAKRQHRRAADEGQPHAGSPPRKRVPLGTDRPRGGRPRLRLTFVRNVSGRFLKTGSAGAVVRRPQTPLEQ